MKYSSAGWLFFFVLFSHASYSADSKGAYAIEGAGIASCQKFMEAAAAKGKVYNIYGGWVEGYITASNEHFEQTFDLTPWQSTGLLLKLVEASCQNNTSQRFHEVVKGLVLVMGNQRLAKGDEYVTLGEGLQYVFQRELLERIQQALTAKGFYKGHADGQFNSTTESSLKDFQKSVGQAQTGLPEQATLYELFREQ